ncbi:MAG: LamG domain-containing protein, partial [Planctomycetota bacterium]
MGDAKVVEDPERGNVLSLDGSGDYLDCGEDPVFSITKQISIGCWINVDAPAEHVQTIISKTGGEQSSWMLGIQTGKVHFYVNEARPTERTMGKVNVTCGKWHHILAMYDGSKTYIYLDGVLDVSEKASGDIIVADSPVCIGEDSENEELCSWSGLIDDLVVFDRTLSPEEIGQLYSKGPGPFAAGQMLEEFIETVQKAQQIAAKQAPQEALGLLKQLIAKYEQWQEQNPKHPVFYYKHVLSDLYYLLAKSKEAAGAAKEEVVDAYKRAVESDKFSMLSAPRQGPSLLWSYDNLESKVYDEIVSSLITEDTDFLRAAAGQAKIMTDRQQSTAAVSFLKGTLAAVARWREKHPFHNLPVESESTVAC